MKNKLIATIIFIAIGSAAQSQDTVKLRLQDAMDSAVKNNREVILAMLDQETAAARLDQSNASFLPRINFSYTAMVTNNPLNSFGFKLQQQSVSPSDFDPQRLNNPSTTQNYATKVEWSQPILNLEMVHQRKAASQQLDMYYYHAERKKEWAIFEVEKAYAQLQLAEKAVIVLTEALVTINSIYAHSKNYFDIGYLQKSDLLLVRVQVASVERKLAEAKSNVLNASDNISLLMGGKRGTVYSVAPLMKIEHAVNFENHAPNNRADFKAMESALKSQDIRFHSEKLSYLPKLNAFGNYMYNDKNAFGFGSNSYLIGAQLSFDLFNGAVRRHHTTEQKIARSRIEQQLNYLKEQSQLELDKTCRQLRDAHFALEQHQTSVLQAAEALRILQNRFQQGLASTTDLLQSQSTFSEQELLLSEAVFSYNTTYAYLRFLTSSPNTNDE